MTVVWACVLAGVAAAAFFAARAIIHARHEGAVREAEDAMDAVNDDRSVDDTVDRLRDRKF